MFLSAECKQVTACCGLFGYLYSNMTATRSYNGPARRYPRAYKPRPAAVASRPHGRSYSKKGSRAASKRPVYTSFGGAGRFYKNPASVPQKMSYRSVEHSFNRVLITGTDNVLVRFIDITQLVADEELPFISGIYGTLYGSDNSTTPTTITLDFISAPGRDEDEFVDIFPSPIQPRGAREYSHLYHPYSTPLNPVLDSAQGLNLGRTRGVIPASQPGPVISDMEGHAASALPPFREFSRSIQVKLNRAWNTGPKYGRQDLDRIFLALHVHSLAESSQRSVRLALRIGYHST